MKRTFVFSLMLLLFVVGAKAGTTEIDLSKGQKQPPGPAPASLSYNPVSATVSETELAVYFDWSVGDANITVYDSSNNVVYQDVVDTDSTSEVYVPVTSWASGDYTITISYGTTNLIGYFQIS